MIQSDKLLVGVCAYNEIHRIAPVIEKLINNQKENGYGIVFGDDGSTDGTGEYLKSIAEQNGFGHIRHEQNSGVGTMIRDIIQYGKENGYNVLTLMSANGKTDPEDLKTMYLPVLSEEYDYVKGNRFMKGGARENMPLFRVISIPLFSAFVSVLMGHRLTDVTCLINASNLKIYDDPDINLYQDWLDTYGLEYYILFYVLKKKYRMKEVPVTIHYPADHKNYSKIKPGSGWWQMIRPWILLRAGIKK